MDRHESVQALLTGHALGELSLVEQREVDAHLRECNACRRDARELAAAFHSVGGAEVPVTPPAHLRARVLQSVADQRGSQPPSAPAPGRRRADYAWLAVAAAVIAALGVLLSITRERANHLDAELRAATVAREDLVRQAATTAAQADRAVAILTAADMQRIDLQGADASPGAVARAYWSPTQGLLIVADRLPSPPPGRAYQVWLIGGGASGPVSAGLIEGPRSGRGMLIAAPPQGVAGGPVTVAVTDEPAGGLPAPTGSKHLLGSI